MIFQRLLKPFLVAVQAPNLSPPAEPASSHQPIPLHETKIFRGKECRLLVSPSVVGSLVDTDGANAHSLVLLWGWVSF